MKIILLNHSQSHTSVRGHFAIAAIGAVFCAASLAACGPKTDSMPIDSTQPVQLSPAATLVVDAVSELGYGQLHTGDTFAAANESLKGALKTEKGANLAECEYAKWEGGPAGMLVMIVENKVARIDVTDSSTLQTREGAKIGDTEDQIKQLYAGRVAVSPHKYDDGNYLRVKSSNPADTTHFMVFEAVKGKVTRYRAGIIPAVDYVEGCS